ncbi:MAG: DUF4115 domain-containing protein [Alphaproteobacteria bacterium]|nr:DUF4115 domain-containing protein [Alphaproteobacteria bacterium]
MSKDNDFRDQIHDGKRASEMLKSARAGGRRRRELSTIARQLCIREEFLEALENGEYNKIPELVYILGFARNYAIELELDPKIIIQKIKLEMGLLEDDEESAEKGIITDGTAQVEAPFNMVIGERSESFAVRNRKWFLGFIATATVVIVALAILYDKIGSHERHPSATVHAVQTVTAQEAPAPKPTPTYSVPVRETFGNENRASATVVLQAISETWLKIEDSRGETLFSRVLTPGDVYYAPTSNVKATIGNAGGLDVYVNGKLAPKIGPDHVRRTGIVLTPAALMPEPVAPEAE